MLGKRRKSNHFLEQMPLIRHIVKESTHKNLHAWKKPKGGHLKESSNNKMDMSLSRHCVHHLYLGSAYH